MIKRVELEHKVKFEGFEYNVLLSEDSDFTTAFETLGYIFGNTKNEEIILIGFDGDEFSSVFKENHERNIYFYSDNKEKEPKRKKFIEVILSKHPTSHAHIFVCGTSELNLFEVNKICSDIIDEDNKNTYIHVIANSSRENTSVRIVIGA